MKKNFMSLRPFWNFRHPTWPVPTHVRYCINDTQSTIHHSKIITEENSGRQAPYKIYVIYFIRIYNDFSITDDFLFQFCILKNRPFFPKSRNKLFSGFFGNFESFLRNLKIFNIEFWFSNFPMGTSMLFELMLKIADSWRIKVKFSSCDQ